MSGLPVEFNENMRTLLGEKDYEAFCQSRTVPPFRGLRCNLLKCGPDVLLSSPELKLRPSPFAAEGFYTLAENPGRHPWHHAGLFYLQEPSAMSAVTAMAPEPGMNVLDLCAAPGGKSTQIAGKMNGKGLLFCNEVSSSRAKALLSNLERLGVRNAVVTCNEADVICGRLAGFFDCVLVDAPCSGEGMFRKFPRAVEEWEPTLPSRRAVTQRAILETAKRAVKTNGVLVYSTCTFSRLENEDVVLGFLKDNRDFELEEIAASFGRPAFGAGDSDKIAFARRILPMDGGEGHFTAKLRRTSGGENGPHAAKPEKGKIPVEFFRYYESAFNGLPYGKVALRKDTVVLIPENLPDLSGLNVLRTGVEAGRLKSGRFEPSHALYMAARPEDFLNKADYSVFSPEIARFLHGEEIESSPYAQNGYLAVLAGGYTVGFGKCVNGVIKNHYPKGLRNNSAEIENL